MDHDHDHDHHEPDDESHRIGLAFAICIAVGLSTMLGVFSLFCVKKMKKTILAAALGFSAGVMIYVSFVEVFPKSIEQLELLDLSHEHAYVYGTLCFIAGIIISVMMNSIVSLIVPHNHEIDIRPLDNESSNESDIENAQKNEKNLDSSDTAALKRLGIFSGIAIGLHNIPEGMATFAAAVQDPSFGGVIAIAIGLHNIPEGLAVAFPIYYATNSKWKAFFWASITAIAEIIGGLISYGIVSDGSDYLINGILFGFVAGIMVHISFGELIPLSHKYSKKRPYVATSSVFFGLSVMALSLIIFELSGSALHAH
eukprot:GHVL01011600.1.p1 GENE.GHVL01011600.1~~GHVL01011600.1.p1  ORF type:complete len:312 (+),score=35.82 GHVL01011600.1:43-978(+)